MYNYPLKRQGGEKSFNFPLKDLFYKSKQSNNQPFLILAIFFRPDCFIEVVYVVYQHV